jgi:hypothetical protein
MLVEPQVVEPEGKTAVANPEICAVGNGCLPAFSNGLALAPIVTI